MCVVPPLGGWCLPSARPSSRLAAALPSWACRLGGAGPLPPRAFGAGCRLRRVFRLLSAFSLVFRVLRVLLFCGWGGFFWCWGGFVGGGAVLGVLFFCVSSSRGWFLVFGWCPVPLGGCRGSCVRVVSRVRLVRAGGLACARGRWRCALGARGGRVSALRLLALQPSRLLLVGGLVGRLGLRCFSRGVGRLGRRPGARRPAPFVFLSFFNIRRACLWKFEI